MRTSEQFPIQTISAAGLGEKIRSLCAKQKYWVTGECKNAKPGKNKSWNFDLLARNTSTGKLVSIRCWIPPGWAEKVNQDLLTQGSSLAVALTDGMSLKALAETNMWENSLQLHVRDIRPGFIRTGEHHHSQSKVLSRLIDMYPQHRRFGLPREKVHSPSEQCIRLGVDSLQRVTVVAPESSQGKDDLVFELGNRFNRPKHISYQSISWNQDDAVSRFRQIVRDAKDDGHGLVIVIRGGGHWSGMQAFETKEIAELILTSEIPVITALGHAKDVSLADRAAFASYVTPTAVAEAIVKTFKAQRSRELGIRDQQRETRDKELLQQAKEQVKDLEANLVASKNDVFGLRREIAERDNQHVQTLLGLARRRVRGYSRLSTGVVIGLTVSLFFGAGGFLGSFGIDPTLKAILLMWCLTLGAAWLVACRLENARLNLHLPATEPMRSPPVASEWITKIKTVRSVQGLRKLQRHIPLNRPDGEI